MDIDKDKIKKILIIKISAVGDIIRALPATVSVAGMFPDATIDFLISDRNIELIETCPYISEIIPFDVGKYSKDVFAFLRFAKEIRRRRYDMVLNFQNTKRYDYLSYLSGAEYRSSIVTLDHPTKGVDGVYKILKTVGLTPKKRRFEYWFTDEDHAFAERFFEENGIEPGNHRIVGLCPGGGWESKLWPVVKYAELADMFAITTGAKIIVFGSKEETHRAEEISLMTSAEVAIASGKTTLRQAARIISECSLFVSNDSGLMHFAAHVGTPTVGIFGCTNPSYHGPSGEGNLSIFRGVECSPCYKPDCRLDFERYYCLLAIQAEEVFKAARKIMR